MKVYIVYWYSHGHEDHYAGTLEELANDLDCFYFTLQAANEWDPSISRNPKTVDELMTSIRKYHEHLRGEEWDSETGMYATVRYI